MNKKICKSRKMDSDEWAMHECGLAKGHSSKHKCVRCGKKWSTLKARKL